MKMFTENTQNKIEQKPTESFIVVVVTYVGTKLFKYKEC